MALASALAASASAGAVHADPVLAETLFQSGRAALTAGDFDSACPKLAESHRLDPAGGTVLLWGICLEKQGKSASAWAALEDALSFALREKNGERVEIARRHLATIEPRLVRVSIHVDGPSHLPSDLVVRRDGVVVPPSALDTPTPIDAGEHALVAEASGFQRFETTFVVPTEPPGESAGPRPSRDVRIRLVPVVLPPASAATTAEGGVRTPIPSPRDESKGSSIVPRPTPWVVAGAGGVLLGLGGFFGLRASGLMDDVRARCPRSPCTDRGAAGLRDEAGRNADRATIALVAGGVLVAGGLTWGFVRQGPSSTVSVAGRF